MSVHDGVAVGGPTTAMPLSPNAALSASSTMDEGAALMYAAEQGAVRSIQAWIRRGGDINAALVLAESGGSTPSAATAPIVPSPPLALAAQSGHATAVRTLLECGARCPSAVWLAAQNGHTAALEALLEAGAGDPNAEDPFGQTPLHYAASYGHAAVVRQLLRYGADPNRRESSGRTALDLSTAAGYLDIASVLRAHMEAKGGIDASGTFVRGALSHTQGDDVGGDTMLPSSSLGAPHAAASVDFRARYPQHAGEPQLSAAATPRPTQATAAPRPFPGFATGAMFMPATGMMGAVLPPYGASAKLIGAAATRAAENLGRLQAWLTSLSLGHMFAAFVMSGFDDVDFIASCGLSDKDVDVIVQCMNAAHPGLPIDIAPGSRKKLTATFNIRQYTAAATPPGQEPDDDDDDDEEEEEDSDAESSEAGSDDDDDDDGDESGGSDDESGSEADSDDDEEEEEDEE